MSAVDQVDAAIGDGRLALRQRATWRRAAEVVPDLVASLLARQPASAELANVNFWLARHRRKVLA